MSQKERSILLEFQCWMVQYVCKTILPHIILPDTRITLADNNAEMNAIYLIYHCDRYGTPLIQFHLTDKVKKPVKQFRNDIRNNMPISASTLNDTSSCECCR